MEKHIILGVHITDRVKHATQVQQTLTNHGCTIRTRLGLHEADQDVCSPNGLILLEVLDDETEAETLSADLAAIEGIEVQTMVFDHP